MKTEEQISAEFKNRVRNRREGFDAAQERVLREIRAEHRRERFILISSPLPVRAAAALIVAGLSAFFLWQVTHNVCELPLCPHAARAEGGDRFIASGKAVPEDFVLNPERYERICHCAPRYSGSLR